MTLRQLIERADAAYAKQCGCDSGLVIAYHENPENAEAGDSLARFIALELCDTFDAAVNATDEAQREEAARVLENGARDLQDVAKHL